MSSSNYTRAINWIHQKQSRQDRQNNINNNFNKTTKIHNNNNNNISVMAARLATQRNFVSIAQSDSSADETMTSPTRTSNGEIVTSSSANGQSVPMQRVMGSQVRARIAFLILIFCVL